jgi:hypothetical protein
LTNSFLYYIIKSSIKIIFQKLFMPKKSKTITPTKRVPFQSIVDAKIDILSGSSISEASKKHGISKTLLKDRLERIDEVLESDLPALTTERQLISQALSDKLKPIKEELSMKSLEILKKADDIILDRLANAPDDMDTKDVLKASDQHSARLARITGIEEDPGAGTDPNARAKVINTFVQNIFHNHTKKLEKDRGRINDTSLTPIDIEVET